LELITILAGDDYINDLTKEMDKHLLPGFILDEYCMLTYLWHEFEEDGVAIRYPGATRGHIEYDKDKVITDVVIYDDTGTGRMGCYKESVREAVKQFIGAKIVIQESEPQECVVSLPEGSEGKQVVVVEHGGTGIATRKALAGLTLASTLASFGGYGGTIIDTYSDMKRLGFFSKAYRNVPQYARKTAQGRNELCACGSSKKYKKCCGA